MMGGFNRGRRWTGRRWTDPALKAASAARRTSSAAASRKAAVAGGRRSRWSRRSSGGGGFNINDMLERLPTISIADVKVGDTIIVSSTQGVDPTRLTAISLVAGADTLLAMLAPRPQPGQTAPNPAAGLAAAASRSASACRNQK